MTGRHRSASRRAQIVAAALELLATTPLDQLTTRQLARSLGISQPALFRHFRSREAILLAVVEAARSDLEEDATEILGRLEDPLERAGELLRRLLERVETRPGLPRLLFLLPEPGPTRDALRGLLSMQTALLAELVREGQRRGSVSAAVDPSRCAGLFLGLIQSAVLRRQLGLVEGSLTAEAPELHRLWLRGIAAGSESDEPAALGPDAGPPSGGERHDSLDVRPLLGRGEDPLEAILARLARLRSTGLLVLTAPFLPRPLVALLTEKGHDVVTRELGSGAWSVVVLVGGGVPFLALDDLEPPEPLQRILESVELLAPGAALVGRLPRYPGLLVQELEARGLTFIVHEEEDGRALVRVERQG